MRPRRTAGVEALGAGIGLEDPEADARALSSWRKSAWAALPTLVTRPMRRGSTGRGSDVAVEQPLGRQRGEQPSRSSPSRPSV